MGILDEAIREHLELKRRRGATDSELKRWEDEAFGPPTRPGEPDFPEQAGGSAEQSGNGVARDSEHPGVAAEEREDEEAALPSEGTEAEPAADQGPAPIETLETVEHPFPEEEVEPEAPPAEEPGPEPEEGTEPAADDPETATEDEEALAERESAQDEDVLADTPEFLKDAPEDDELWFEQGKPKDFDF